MPSPSESLQTRTREDVLAFAYRRGTRLRRQRLVVRSAAVAAGVMALATPVVLVVHDSTAPKPQKVHVVDSPPTTLPGDDVHSETQVGALGPAPASGAAPPSQGAAPARKVSPPPVQMQSPPTTATVNRAPLACARQDVQVTVVTDKASYLPADTVRITARLRNASNRVCAPATGAALTITGPDGQAAFTDQKGAPPAASLPPGATVEVAFEWATGTAPQGDYQTSVVWRAGRDLGPGTSTFRIGLA